MRKIKPSEITANPVELIGSDWMLVTAGNMGAGFNTMTASWGGIGFLWNKPVAFVFVRPQRYTFEFTEREEFLTLSFFHEQFRTALNICGTVSGRDTDKVWEAGLTPFTTESGSVAFKEAKMILECRKLYAGFLDGQAFTDASLAGKLYPGKDFHKMYVVEISSVWVEK